MSRETDSSSSGPQGRGGAAYPSGTPPYGSRQYPSLHPQDDRNAPDADAADGQPDEPRTETTLTTRIRINIPGSRPIPPVVMRTPMSETDVAARSAGGSGGGSGASGGEREGERTGSTPRPDASGSAGAPTSGAPAAPAGGEKPPASDWFAPRKSAAAAPPQGAATGGPGPTGVPPDGEPLRRSGLADLADAEAAPGLPTRPRAGAPEDPLRGTGPNPILAQGGPGGPGAPGGPGLPRRGDGPGARDGFTPGDGFAPADGFAPGDGFAPPGHGTPPHGTRRPGGPAGPTTGPATGDMPFGPGPGGPAGGPPQMSDDTAVLTPQRPSPEPPAGGHVSGDTLTSGIPVVPGDGPRSPFPSSGPARSRGGAPGSDAGFSAAEFPAGPGGGPAGPAGPVSAADDAEPAPRPAPARPAKKGRSKLVLAGAGVVGVLAVAYGAGLLLNHSDVPKSTTVLGVDIGGGTRDEAVNKLDSALGDRAAATMQLSVGGKKAELAPDKAGLSLDSQATVRGAAGSDYNPVSVIGSLFGGERVAQPVIVVDEEKLAVALADLAGSAGSASEGTIRFEPGRVVAVPGKPGETLDVQRSMISVKDAYRAQVETGKPNVVTLPVATREPTIGQAEIDRAMKEFAEPAMSGLITVRAGGKQIQFGPAKSLPKILSMRPIEGKLVEHYDKAAIEQLLEGVFDGITITKADGRQHPVSADDVAQAMGPALRGKTPAERTAVIDLDPS